MSSHHHLCVTIAYMTHASVLVHIMHDVRYISGSVYSDSYYIVNMHAY